MERRIFFGADHSQHPISNCCPYPHPPILMACWIQGFVSLRIIKCGNCLIKFDIVISFDFSIFVFVPYKPNIHATELPFVSLSLGGHRDHAPKIAFTHFLYTTRVLYIFCFTCVAQSAFIRLIRRILILRFYFFLTLF